MGKRRGLKAALAAAVVSGFSLFGVFNAAAAEETANPTPTPITAPENAAPDATVTLPAAANDTAPAPVVTVQDQLTRALTAKLDEMEGIARGELNGSDPVAVLRYQPPQDTRLQNGAQELIRLIQAGADINAVDSASGATVLGRVMWMAYMLDRPDIVREAISAGGDPQTRDGRGWNGIDHVLMMINQSQRTYAQHVQTAVQIYKIIQTETGMTFRQAANFRQFSFAPDITALAQSIVALDILRQNGYITDQRFEQVVFGDRARLRNLSSQIDAIDPAFFSRYGARLADYPDAAPGGPEPYRVQAGDTLDSLAQRFMPIMDAATPEEARQRIADRNNITLDAAGTPSRDLVADERLLIPVSPEYMVGQFTLPAGRSLQDIAPHQVEVFFRQGATQEDVLRMVARLNGLDEQAVVDGTERGTPGTPYWFPFHNSIIEGLPRLSPPPSYDPAAPNRDVYMVVVESQSYHGKQTLRTTMGIGYAINPNVDLNDFFALDELLLSYPNARGNSDALKMLLDLQASGLNGRVIFSHSMAINRQDMDASDLDQMRDTRYPDDVTYEQLRVLLDAIEAARPMVFNASGNWYPKDGPYIQSHLTTHSPRSINVGAVGRYPGLTGSDTATIVAPYSNGGADVCQALPMEYNGSQMEGTSFATPSLASQARQFVEWYGNVLTFEEIMSVALMTADRDMLDVDIDTQTGRPVNPQSQNGPYWARFQVNGAGLPFHTRCGAGYINIERWEANLRLMVEMKQNMQNPAEDVHSHTLQAGAPTQIVRDANGEIAEYVYRIPVPQDMTVGKLTFMVPQYQGYHSDVTVRMPSGFESTLLRSNTDIVSTSAFNYEDIRQGQYIELRSRYALGPTAGVVLRGQDHGNVIQVMRDHLRSTGILPAPLSTMAGATVLTQGQDAPTYRRPLRLIQGPR